MKLNIVTEEQLEPIKNDLAFIKKTLESICNNDSPSLLNNQETADLLNVSLRTLQKYRDTGLLEFSQIGRKILYKRAFIDEFITNNSIAIQFRSKRRGRCTL
jgi:excisionase family DNA binding protein